MKRVCGQHVLIVNVQIDGAAADLLLTHLNGQNLVIGKGHFLPGLSRCDSHI